MKRCMGCMKEYEDGITVCPHCGYIQGTPAKEAYHLSPETILNGRYLVGRVLGFGGFGITYIAWDLQLEKKVAIKEYMPSDFATRAPGEVHVSVYSGNAGDLFISGMKGFIDESKRLAVFSHEEGIVHIFDSFLENCTAYIVMEYLEGKTLKQLLLERGGKISYQEAINYLLPVLRSLDVVHQAGIIHRDIAPDNIFITNDGKVKLIDFGASRYFTLSQSRSLSVILKQGYAPPEQYNSRGKQGPWTDIYAVCAVLYRAVTGIVPEDSMERCVDDKLQPPSKLGIVLPQGIENALMNGLNTQPENRIQSVWVLAQSLGGEISIQRIKEKKKKDDVGRWSKKQITIAVISGVLVLVILLATLLGVFLSKPALDPDVYATVPDYIGKTFMDAQEKWTKYCKRKEITNIDLAVLQGVPVDQIDGYEVDQIYEMKPKAGAWFKKAPENKEYLYVTVVLPSVQEIIDENTGKDSWKMKDLENYSKDDAQRIINSMEGVNVEFKEVPSEKSEGTVVDSDIKPGDSVNPNDNITIDISDGSLVDMVDVVDPDAPTPITADQVKWIVEPTWNFKSVEPIYGPAFSDIFPEGTNYASGTTPFFTFDHPIIGRFSEGCEMSFPLYSNLPEYYNVQGIDGLWSIFYMPTRSINNSWSDREFRPDRYNAEIGLSVPMGGNGTHISRPVPWNVIHEMGGYGGTDYKIYWDETGKNAYFYCSGYMTTSVQAELVNIKECDLHKPYPAQRAKFTGFGEISSNRITWNPNTVERDIIPDESVFAYVTPDGNLITDFIYQDTDDFSDGIAGCRRDGLWGYIDETGKEITDFIYTDTFPCTDDTMVVQKDGQYGLLYRDGSVLIGFGEFEALAPSYNNELWAKQGGKWGLIDLNDVKSQMGFMDESSAEETTKAQVTTTEASDSEGILRKIVANAAGEEPLDFVYGDFDGNGSYEAFAVCGKILTNYENNQPMPKTEDGYNYVSECSFWFVDANGSEKIKSEEEMPVSGYVEPPLKVGKRLVFSFQFFSWGPASTNYLWGVKNGQPYELELSGNIENFSESNGRFSGERAFFHPGGGRDWSDHYFYFNENTLEFVEE